jgi:hypothetical protein
MELVFLDVRCGFDFALKKRKRYEVRRLKKVRLLGGLKDRILDQAIVRYVLERRAVLPRTVLTADWIPDL